MWYWGEKKGREESKWVTGHLARAQDIVPLKTEGPKKKFRGFLISVIIKLSMIINISFYVECHMLWNQNKFSKIHFLRTLKPLYFLKTSFEQWFLFLCHWRIIGPISLTWIRAWLCVCTSVGFRVLYIMM